MSPSKPAAGTTRRTSRAASGTRKSRAIIDTSPIRTWCRSPCRRSESTQCESLGELPAELARRLEVTYGIKMYDSDVLVNQGRAVVDYYVELAELTGDGQCGSNWVTQDVLRVMNDRNLSIEQLSRPSADTRRSDQTREGRRLRHEQGP